MEKVLNVGCGLKTEGTDFLDLYPVRPEVIKYNADIEKMPYKNNTFDKIICNFMFEHLRNHKLFLDECFRVLKKGGELNLLTDNALFYGWNLNKTHKGGYDGMQGDEDIHYALFTKQHLRNHMKAANLKVESINYVQFHSKAFKYRLSKLVGLFLLRDQRYPRIRIIAVK